MGAAKSITDFFGLKVLVKNVLAVNFFVKIKICQEVGSCEIL